MGLGFGDSGRCDGFRFMNGSKCPMWRFMDCHEFKYMK